MQNEVEYICEADEQFSQIAKGEKVIAGAMSSCKDFIGLQFQNGETAIFEINIETGEWLRLWNPDANCPLAWGKVSISENAEPISRMDAKGDHIVVKCLMQKTGKNWRFLAANGVNNYHPLQKKIATMEFNIGVSATQSISFIPT